MVKAAKSRAKDQGISIEFVLADAGEMGFADGSFDCTRVDRTLQHVADPGKVLAEMARVTKTGGRIVAYEPDWGTFTMGSVNRRVTRKIADLWCDTFRSGWIGRYLYEHFRNLGLDDILICPSTLVVTDFDVAERVFDLSKNAEKAVDLGLVSSHEAREWLGELKDDNLRGVFFCSYTGFMAAGRKR
jgi:ubiquinone/menaquinone biosynthesis C-methylase UbiE